MPDAIPAPAQSRSAGFKRIYVCSSNGGKLRDFASAAHASKESEVIIEPLPGLEGISPPEENGRSFEENAVAKAVYYSAFTRGLVLADDSGLEVHALGGAPGIHSARYAGPGATDAENNNFLLSNLAGAAQRGAQFVCVLALARGGKALLTSSGTVAGTILNAPQGTAGFGYDPLFWYAPLQSSFAELTAEQKLAVSHRGNALRALFARLEEILAA
jgi:XTP/dITP diphosphohydrolase